MVALLLIFFFHVALKQVESLEALIFILYIVSCFLTT